MKNNTYHFSVNISILNIKEKTKIEIIEYKYISHIYVHAHNTYEINYNLHIQIKTSKKIIYECHCYKNVTFINKNTEIKIYKNNDGMHGCA